MTGGALESLLVRISSGDRSAAEEIFRIYEPYLRKVVRRLLPAKFRTKMDSEDVVQSVWADVLKGFRLAGRRFASPAHLRAFLAMVTRHRLGDRLRHYQSALDREQPLAGSCPEDQGRSPHPRPSQIVQAQDLWEQMLALCPPAHHEVLRLKRQGLSLEEVASRSGLHEGSVRRILRKLARQLAFRKGPSAFAPAADGRGSGP
jgi:RNA polymerase sigma-70 factor (ECF subfamily)